MLCGKKKFGSLRIWVLFRLQNGKIYRDHLFSELHGSTVSEYSLVEEAQAHDLVPILFFIWFGVYLLMYIFVVYLVAVGWCNQKIYVIRFDPLVLPTICFFGPPSSPGRLDGGNERQGL